MNLIRVPAMAKDGRELWLTINADKINKILKVPVPGDINGPDGEPVSKMMPAIQMGVELIVLACSEDALMMRLLDCDMEELAEWRAKNKWEVEKNISLDGAVGKGGLVKNVERTE